ncbi:MAG: stage III sporulation protein AB [Firmicutes bacterium]|nr:stage III sporulation protein AB [Bacillota bacterium]
MKAIGAVIIITVCCLYGIYKSYGTSYRKNDLKELKTALMILRAETEYMNSSIYESCLAACGRVKRPVSDILRIFAQRIGEKRGEEPERIWNEVIEEKMEDTYFAGEDISALKSMGKIFGYSDDSIQKKNIDMMIEYINEKCMQIESESEKNKRMYRSIGILSGMMIVLVLL